MENLGILTASPGAFIFLLKTENYGGFVSTVFSESTKGFLFHITH